MQFVSRLALLAFVSCSFVVIVGCDDKKPESASAPAGPAEALPADLMASAAPDGARDVADVRNAADGDEVVVRGRIGGNAKPFVEGRAAFQLVDLSLATCDKEEGDHCPTPWDYCCDDKSEVAAKSVTVQVANPAGQPLRATLDGVGGLKPMIEVTVKGKLQKSADGKAVTVNATQCFVKQG